MPDGQIGVTDSILRTVRKFVGGEEDGTNFDLDLILSTNAALAVVSQLGVGPKEGFSITGEDETWSDLLGENHSLLNVVLAYVALKVQMIFDPTSSGSVKEIKSELLKEFEWRVTVAVDELNKTEVISP